MKKTLLVIYLILSVLNLFSQSYTWDGENLILDNGYIKRVIKYQKDSMKFTTRQILCKDYTGDFIEKESAEFAFLANDKQYNGFSNWNLIGCEKASDTLQGTGVTVRLKNIENVEVDITYLLYPKLPLIRKKIKIVNNGTADLKIESLDIEVLSSTFWKASTLIYNNYGRMKDVGSYVGDWDDALIVLHNTDKRAGMALGNESPGVLKRVAYHTDGHATVELGLTHCGQDFPFRKWLKPGQAWTSPYTFMALYSNTDNGTQVINGTVNEFVRKYMGVRFSQIKTKPVFVYNTWYPFCALVSDTLVRSVAKAAAECGLQEFIIDDGWQFNADKITSDKKWGSNYGDWLVDNVKFPNSLTSTFDYIRSLGMKPGLWISIGSANSNSKVFKEHPEWFVKNYENNLGNLHFVADESDFYTSCMATDWFDYIKGVILNLVKEHGLAYAKLDLSLLTSAYVDDIRVSGCYATNHPYHRDHEESYIAIYERTLQLFDELHREAPELFIDCTFETVGKMQCIDYAFCKHAEGNWLSNFDQAFPAGALRVRQMAWWRSPAMPAGSLVIGNQPMDGEDFLFSLKSLIGTLPIVLGDPRKIPFAKRSEIKQWANWMINMQKKYDYMSFRQDLPGLGEPQEGAWDGWQRINIDNQNGGIIGIFKQGALENSRTIFVTGLNPDAKYRIRQTPTNKVIITASGKQLMQKGFEINMIKLYDANIYEIEKLE